MVQTHLSTKTKLLSMSLNKYMGFPKGELLLGELLTS